MKFTTILSFILVIVGAIVWLLVGIFDFNLVAVIFGAGSFCARTIYTLVGLASLWLIFYAVMYKPFRNL